MLVKKLKRASEILRLISDMSTLVFHVRELIERGGKTETKDASEILDSLIGDADKIKQELMFLRLQVNSKGDDNG